MTANPTVLERDKVVGDVAKHFKEEIEALHDLVDYGTHLFCRCMKSSEHREADSLIPGVFLKQHLAMLDATEVLLAQGWVARVTCVAALFERGAKREKRDG